MIFSLNSFFIAWSGVLACLFDDFPELVHQLKTRIDDTYATHLPKEHPGSKFPKMTLAALHDGRVLSSNDLLRLTLLCEFYRRIIRLSPIALSADNMSLLTFHNRMLSRISWMCDIPVSMAHRANFTPLKAGQCVPSSPHQSCFSSTHPATESQRILSEVCLDKLIMCVLPSTSIFARANTPSTVVTHSNESKHTTVAATRTSECGMTSSNVVAEAAARDPCLSLVGEDGMPLDIGVDINAEALACICASTEAVWHTFERGQLARLVSAVAQCVEAGTLLLGTHTNASDSHGDASISPCEQSQALHARLAAYLPQVQRAGSRVRHYTEPCTGHTLVVRLADIGAAKTSVHTGARGGVNTLLMGVAGAAPADDMGMPNLAETSETLCGVPVDAVVNTALSSRAGIDTGSAAPPQEPLAHGDSHPYGTADGCEYLRSLDELLRREFAHVLASHAQHTNVAGDAGNNAVGHLPHTSPLNGDVEAAVRNKEAFLHLLACFQRDVETLLPGYYYFFPVDSLHITIRGL